MEREYLTVQEAAQLAGVEQITVRSWYRKGWITKYLIRGRLVRVSRTEILKLITPEPVVTGSGS